MTLQDVYDEDVKPQGGARVKEELDVSVALLPTETLVKEFRGKFYKLRCVEAGGNQITLTQERVIIKTWTTALCGCAPSTYGQTMCAFLRW